MFSFNQYHIRLGKGIFSYIQGEGQFFRVTMVPQGISCIILLFVVSNANSSPFGNQGMQLLIAKGPLVQLSNFFIKDTPVKLLNVPVKV